MCGRFALTQTPNTVQAWFAYPERPNFPPRYNIAPTQPVAVVLQRDGAPHFILMRWGFIPGFVKDPKDFPLVINIRAETAAQKPSFRNALQRRRCLIPADGFYEWQRLGKTSQPFLIRRPDQGLFAFACLWETWSGADGSEIDTVAILTTQASGLLTGIHERTPVVLDRDASGAWIEPDLRPAEIEAFLKSPPDDFFEALRIGNAVNRVANDDASLQVPIEAPRRAERPARRDDPQGSLF